MASVVLTWSGNPAADNVTAYKIYGANGTSVAIGSCALLATVTGLTWTDTGLPVAQARTYYIVAHNAVGDSAAEGPINVTTVASSTYVPLSYLDTDGTLAANSDTRVATQKAVRTYVAANAGSSSGFSLDGGRAATGGVGFVINAGASTATTELDFIAEGGTA